MRADDSAYAQGRGCYTTVRIVDGRARYEQRHVDRLVSGATALALGELDAKTIRQALADLSAAAFERGSGIVRLQVSRDGRGGVRLIGVPRALGADPPGWSAIVATTPHDGPNATGGLKVTGRVTLELAATEADRAGVDESLLFDATDRLVEGSRSNVFVACGHEAIWTPPLTSGAVAGIARAICLEQLAHAVERPISRSELASADELIAVNAVRGARAILCLDGKLVAGGRPGPWSERVARALASES